MFLTFKQLSKEYGVDERKCRYKVFSLIKSGALVEPNDIRKTDFKDDKHFTWQINAITFGEKTGLQPILFPEKNKVDTNDIQNGNQNNDRVVEMLKEQLEDKKTQIARLEKSAERYEEAMKKERDEVHVLTGALIQKQNKVEELLLLTSGSVVSNPVTEVDTKENGGSETNNQTDTKDAEVVSENGNEPIPNNE